MNKKTKFFLILLFLISLSGCSSITDRFDVASIIDKTEEWIFSDSKNENNKIDDNPPENKENIEEIVEEVFPDINEIPEERPEFEEIDKDFFADQENNDNNNNLIEEDTLKTDAIKKERGVDDSVFNKNILAISKIKENIKLKLVRLLKSSDPPVDKNQPLLKGQSSDEIGNLEKVAIIQFPNNSIIPDENADAVMNEIYRLYPGRRVKLIGHSSKSGGNTTIGKRINMEISISRAETIKKMLVEKGFTAENIEVIGKGDLEPLIEEARKYGEAVNRRVEIFFISE